MFDLVIRGQIASEQDEINTQACIQSALSHLNIHKIIVCTWKTNYSPNILLDQCTHLYLYQPIKMLYGTVGTDFRKPVPVLQQSYLSLKGLNRATMPSAIVCRNDLIFNNDNINKLFSRKIGALTTYNPYRNGESVNNICDWLHFGEVEELKKYYSFHENCELSDEYNIRDHGECEHLLFKNYMKCHGKIITYSFGPTINQRREAITNYSRFINQFTAKELGITSIKFGKTAYAANSYLSAGLFTERELRTLNSASDFRNDILADFIYLLRKVAKKLKVLRFFKRAFML